MLTTDNDSPLHPLCITSKTGRMPYQHQSGGRHTHRKPERCRFLSPRGGSCGMLRGMLSFSWESLYHAAIRICSHGWVAFVLILLAAYLFSRFSQKLLRPLLHRLPEMTAQLLRKTLIALIWCLAAVQALHAIGVDVISLLGAAGVAGIAIGFASQTALSNIISGMFIAGEHSIKLGDYIHTGTLEGTVEKISMLAITIRQPDNSRLRIPCEMLIKNPVSNETNTQTRRCAIAVGLAYGTDLDRVQRLAEQVVRESPFLMDTPAPCVRFQGFGDSSVNLHVCAWCKAENYYETRYLFAKALYEAFNRESISFAFPVRTVVQK